MKGMYFVVAIGVLLFPSLLVAGQDTVRTWTGAQNNNFSNTQNWTPEGPPENTHVIIPQTNPSPVLSSPLFAPVRSVNILRGGRLEVTALGRLNTSDSLRIDSAGILNVSSTQLNPINIGGNSIIAGVFDVGQLLTETMNFDGRLVIETTGSFHIGSPIDISNIDDDVVLNGSLAVDSGIAAEIWCHGDWIRGPGSSFNAGASTFYFQNPGRQLTVDRGSFNSLLLGPVLNTLRIGGNVSVGGTLTLSDTVVVLPGDTLTVLNTSITAIIDTLGGRITRGAVRRALPTSTSRIRFHDSNINLRFHNTVGIPTFVTIDAAPDSNLQPNPLRFVRRFYDIGRQGGSGFAAELTVRYEPAELDSGVVEDSLRLWRSIDDGRTWQYVPSRVVVANHVVIADTVSEFSKWSFGLPASSPTAVRESHSGILPQEPRLAQNYPNPFNPATTFSFSVPRAAFVTLTVYNMIGQEVEILVDGEKQPGMYQVEWNPIGLPSGVYFYRLMGQARNGETFVQTKKMILLK